MYKLKRNRFQKQIRHHSILKIKQEIRDKFLLGQQLLSICNRLSYCYLISNCQEQPRLQVPHQTQQQCQYFIYKCCEEVKIKIISLDLSLVASIFDKSSLIKNLKKYSDRCHKLTYLIDMSSDNEVNLHYQRQINMRVISEILCILSADDELLGLFTIQDAIYGIVELLNVQPFQYKYDQQRYLQFEGQRSSQKSIQKSQYEGSLKFAFAGISNLLSFEDKEVVRKTMEILEETQFKSLLYSYLCGWLKQHLVSVPRTPNQFQITILFVIQNYLSILQQQHIQRHNKSCIITQNIGKLLYEYAVLKITFYNKLQNNQTEEEIPLNSYDIENWKVFIDLLLKICKIIPLNTFQISEIVKIGKSLKGITFLLFLENASEKCSPELLSLSKIYRTVKELDEYLISPMMYLEDQALKVYLQVCLTMILNLLLEESELEVYQFLEAFMSVVQNNSIVRNKMFDCKFESQVFMQAFRHLLMENGFDIPEGDFRLIIN